MNDNYPQFVIDPKKYQKNKSLIVFLIIFWIIWSIGSILLVFKIIEDFSFILLVFFLISLVITLGIPAWIYSMNKIEFITIANDKICIRGGFLQFGEQCIQKSSLAALVLRREGASYSLMMVQEKGIKPYIVPIAPFIGLKDKIELQKSLASFLKNYGCDFALINNIE